MGNNLRSIHINHIDLNNLVVDILNDIDELKYEEPKPRPKYYFFNFPVEDFINRSEFSTYQNAVMNLPTRYIIDDSYNSIVTAEHIIYSEDCGGWIKNKIARVGTLVGDYPAHILSKPIPEDSKKSSSKYFYIMEYLGQYTMFLVLDDQEFQLKAKQEEIKKILDAIKELEVKKNAENNSTKYLVD